MTRPLTLETLRSDIISLFYFSKSYFVRPLPTISREPDWDYQKSVVFLVFGSIISATLSALVQGNLGYMLIVSFIFLPLIAVGLAVAMSVILAQVVRFVHQRQIETEKIFQIVAIAFFPVLFFRIFHSFAPPVTLVGLAATCLLLIVGLVDRLQLPRKSMIKIISIFFALYFVYWSFDMVKRSSRKMASQSISEDSLKVLDQEFKTNDEN